jgi:hypothetical protein
MLEDFYHTEKIQRLRPGLNPRTPEASMLTTRPSKPSSTELPNVLSSSFAIQFRNVKQLKSVRINKFITAGDISVVSTRMGKTRLSFFGDINIEFI